MKIKKRVPFFLTISIFIKLSLFNSCSLNISGHNDKESEPYHVEGTLLTSNHFGTVLTEFEYDACGIIPVGGKKPEIEKYEWDWSSDGIVDHVTYPPECKVTHRYSGVDAGVVVTSVKVLVKDESVGKRMSTKSTDESETSQNTFKTWNYETWLINGGVIEDDSCNNLRAGETCDISFFAKYMDHEGIVNNLPFASLCVSQQDIDEIENTEMFIPVKAATIGEFKKYILDSDSNIDEELREQILNNLKEKGLILTGDDNSLIQFNSSADCNGLQLVTNVEGKIVFQMKAKTSLVGNPDTCLSSVSSLSACEVNNSQTLIINANGNSLLESDSDEYEPLNKNYVINPDSAVAWKIYNLNNLSADLIGTHPVVNYQFIALDQYNNPIIDPSELSISVSDLSGEGARISKGISITPGFSNDKLSLFNVSVNYVSAKARDIELLLNKSGSTISSVDVAITNGNGFQISCVEDCPDIQGTIKSSGTGFLSLNVFDKFGNPVHSDRPVVYWSVKTASNAPVLSISSVVTDDNGVNRFNLSNLTHGKRRGNYEIVASLGSSSISIPVKTLPGEVSGISFYGYDDNADNMSSGLSQLRDLEDPDTEPSIIKNVNYKTLSEKYGKTVNVFLVDTENNIIDGNSLNLTNPEAFIVPESMVMTDKNINPGCTINSNNNCKVGMNFIPLGEEVDTPGFNIDTFMNYPLNVNHVKIVASLDVAGHNYKAVSGAIEAKLGYGYKINSIYYQRDTSSGVKEKINILSEVDFDRGQTIFVEICPDETMTLDPRNSDLGIVTNVSLIDNGDIISDNNIPVFEADFASGSSMSDCSILELEYKYPETEGSNNDILITVGGGSDNPVSTEVPLTINSVSKAHAVVTPNEVTFNNIAFETLNVISDVNIIISNSGEQGIASSTLIINETDSDCFRICDERGENCETQKDIQGDNANLKIMFLSGECVAPFNSTVTANAVLSVSSTSITGQSMINDINIIGNRNAPVAPSEPELSVSDDYVGPVCIGDSSNAIFDITNSGGTAYNVRYDTTGPLTISPIKNSDACTGTILEGSECRLGVVFQPVSSNANGSIIITFENNLGTERSITQDVIGRTINPISVTGSSILGTINIGGTASTEFDVSLSGTKNPDSFEISEIWWYSPSDGMGPNYMTRTHNCDGLLLGGTCKFTATIHPTDIPTTEDSFTFNQNLYIRAYYKISDTQTIIATKRVTFTTKVNR